MMAAHTSLTHVPPSREGGLAGEVRTLIAVRVVAVTSLLLAALIIQTTADVILPLNYLYLVTGLTYVFTLIYIFVGKYVANRTTNLYIQFIGDIALETLLVYFTGGVDSPFSFLYLISIITASTLLYRRGGLIIASLCVIFYGALVDLIYWGIIPLPGPSVFAPTPWNSLKLYVNLATNFAGFYATALLTSYISEQLRRAARELDLNRQNLAELRALNENVIASIPSGVLTLTAEGKISFANAAAAQMLAPPEGKLVGRHVIETGLFDEEAWEECLIRVFRDSIARGEREVVLGGAEEEQVIGFAVTPLMTFDGEPYGITLIFQDLTERRKLEEQLRMKDRMAAVGELSAGIAHEIRNPLAAISGSVQVLRKSERLEPKEQRLMSIILTESERLNQSIASFLRFVKPQERAPEPFDVAASLSDTIELFRNSVELGPGHAIIAEIEPPSVTLTGDPNQIRQVFWNVVKNAVQAMPHGGNLRITTSLDDGHYRISFRDEGKGMSPEEIRRLFQPFRTSFAAGTGLGMAISYRIVQEHDGTIDVESQPEHGTTITISLPAARAMIAAPAVAH
jgi:two-component system, NtrC family, sensor histidine kinase PilS